MILLTACIFAMKEIPRNLNGETSSKGRLCHGSIDLLEQHLRFCCVDPQPDCTKYGDVVGGKRGLSVKVFGFGDTKLYLRMPSQ